jgi:hypothetical protein
MERALLKLSNDLALRGGPRVRRRAAATLSERGACAGAVEAEYPAVGEDEQLVFDVPDYR